MTITTQREARARFNRDILPGVIQRYGRNDKPAISEAWGEWLDTLCKNGQIPERGYMTWTLS